MNRKIELPATWDNIMFRVRQVLPSAFLAGGALRDLDNGRPVKDLDVFFTEGFKYDEVLAALGDVYVCQNTCPGQYMDAAKEVETSYRFAPFDPDTPELNLIQLDERFNPAGIIDRVDFGLCQIGADVMGVYSTDLYESDKRNQCFTLTRAENPAAVKRSLKRYERISAKYPGWPLVVPPEHQEMVRLATIEETFTFG